MSFNRYLADRGVLPEIQASIARAEFLRPRDDRDLFGTFAHMLGQGQPGLGSTSPFPRPGRTTQRRRHSSSQNSR